ncbi:MAG: sulfotransferase [Phycisphaeraceae bacterium]|nr:MAG: sulfotransferase [Phycisphaeraceae bacterium]
MLHAQVPLPSTRPPTHPYDRVPLTILSGVGRSGTTILRQALSKHPDLDSTDLENNIILDLLEAASRNRTIPSRFHALRVPEAIYEAHFAALLLRLLWPCPRARTPERLLAYTNLRPQGADQLLRLFPHARIIYIVRNGIEVVGSRLRFAPFQDRDVGSHAETWRVAHDMARWGEKRREFLLVRHEWLLAPDGPERMMDTILPFLGLTRHQPCTDHFRSELVHPTSDRPGSILEAKALTPADPTKPINLSLRDRAERWKDWNPDDRLAFDRTCAEAMAYFGYTVPWNTTAAA